MGRVIFIILLASFLFIGCGGNNVGHASAVFTQNSFQESFTLTNEKTAYSLKNQQLDTSELPLSIEGTITGLSIDFEATLTEQDSYARVILVADGKEYLVFQAGFPFDQTAFSNVCEETCTLDNVNPEKLIVETSEDGSEITITHIYYATEKTLKSAEDSKAAQVQYKIETMNSKQSSWTAGDTGVCDLSYSEKKILYNGWFGNTCGFECYKDGVFNFCETDVSSSGTEKSTADVFDVVIFDWANRHGENWITSVKNQGSCGSCWDFSAVGAVEGVINIFFNQHLNMDLSEQYVLDCSSGSCSGWTEDGALSFISNQGIIPEAMLPYKSFEYACNASPELDQYVWRINRTRKIFYGTQQYPKQADLSIKRNLTNRGPLTMGGPPDVWNHAIVLTGFGYNQDGTYWIIKNQWGTGWGNQGYGKISITPARLRTTAFNTAETPIPPPGQTYDTLCVDSDGDSYCSWGIGSKPAVCSPDIPLTETGVNCCSSQCNAEPDCNDALASTGACSQEQLLCGGFPILQGGEVPYNSGAFGSFTFGNDTSCCGDDSSEFAVSGKCCNALSDYLVNGSCTPTNIGLTIYADTLYPAQTETTLLSIEIGQTVYFRATVTTNGSECTNCMYEWYVDDILQGTTQEFSYTFNQRDNHLVKVQVTDEQSHINLKDIDLLVGIKQITENDKNQTDPRIYGNNIVYEDRRNNNLDIYRYDLSNDAESWVTDSVYHQYKPSIYEDIVTYANTIDIAMDLYRIKAHNISDGTTRNITTYTSKYYPSNIYKNYIVFGYFSGNYSIHVYNLDTLNETYLPGYLQQNPEIDNNKIVWYESRNGNNDIFVYDILTKQELQITNNSFGQQSPDISGNYVVWQDNRSNNWDIYLYNLATQTERQITLDSADQTNPSIYGNIVVWQDKRNGNWDVYRYDIATQQTERITYQNEDQINPDIHTNSIVWQDYRDGNWNIYMAIIEPSEGTTCPSSVSEVISAWIAKTIALQELRERLIVWKACK
ncbi:PKD domain-containing protein [Candidatus Woesearchaeota archaeon]|nr:MAG: PKD domain-containing protein [Candidatus Woesearchaeota archaeon]